MMAKAMPWSNVMRWRLPSSVEVQTEIGAFRSWGGSSRPETSEKSRKSGQMRPWAAFRLKPCFPPIDAILTIVCESWERPRISDEGPLETTHDSPARPLAGCRLRFVPSCHRAAIDGRLLQRGQPQLQGPTAPAASHRLGREPVRLQCHQREYQRLHRRRGDADQLDLARFTGELRHRAEAPL